MNNFLKRTNGNALFIILIAVALFAALSYALFSGRGQGATSSQAYRIAEEVNTQIQGIRSAILECILLYNSSYPTTPGSTLLADIDCPGNPAANKRIFSGGAARFLPPAPRPFTPWTYINNDTGAPGTGVRIVLQTTETDAGIDVALQDLATRYHPDEIQVVTGASPRSLTLWVKRN